MKPDFLLLLTHTLLLHLFGPHSLHPIRGLSFPAASFPLSYLSRLIMFLLVYSPLPKRGFPINETRQATTREYKRQVGNSQSLLHKRWFNIYEYELHKSRKCDSVTRWQLQNQASLRIQTHNFVIASHACSLTTWPQSNRFYMHPPESRSTVIWLV